MPNHVYNWISVEDKYTEKIEEIAKVGLARYYKPMPEELILTSAPTTIISEKEYKEQEKKRKTGEKIWNTGITLAMSKEFKSKFEFDNWYEWALHNWGTKWGCYDNEVNNDLYSYTTAWSTLDMELLDMLAKDIPNFWFGWEEEQGYGQEWEYKNGVSRLDMEWDLPEWKETDVEGVSYLSEAYETPEGKYDVGYYCEYNINEWLAEDFDDAVKEYKSLTITEV